MTAQILHFDGVTRHDIPVERVMDNAKEAGLTSAIILGWDEDGDIYFAASMADGGDALWFIEKAKRALLSYGDE